MYNIYRIKKGENKMETKNATLRFVWEPDDYQEVDMSFRCDEDMTFFELVDFFKKFAIAMSYSPETVNRYLYGREED